MKILRIVSAIIIDLVIIFLLTTILGMVLIPMPNEESKYENYLLLVGSLPFVVTILYFFILRRFFSLGKKIFRLK